MLERYIPKGGGSILRLITNKELFSTPFRVGVREIRTGLPMKEHNWEPYSQILYERGRLYAVMNTNTLDTTTYLKLRMRREIL